MEKYTLIQKKSIFYWLIFIIIGFYRFLLAFLIIYFIHTMKMVLKVESRCLWLKNNQHQAFVDGRHRVRVIMQH